MKRFITLAIVIFCTLIFAGSGDWYIVSNPTNENPEAVWSAKGDSDASYEIRYSYLDGTDWAPSAALTSDAIEDHDPRLAFDSNGNRKVAWWTDQNMIKFSTLPTSGGTWSTPETISDENEECRHPVLVVHSGTVYTGYERIDASGRSVLASSEDSPDPWAADLIRSTQRTTDLEIRIHSYNGHLWLDWVDSDSDLGYSEYTSGSWGTPEYETYSGENDIGNGRQRIRQKIVE